MSGEAAPLYKLSIVCSRNIEMFFVLFIQTFIRVFVLDAVYIDLILIINTLCIIRYFIGLNTVCAILSMGPTQ